MQPPVQPMDPRGRVPGGPQPVPGPSGPMPGMGGPAPGGSQPSTSSAGPADSSAASGSTDAEKAKVISQVMKLTDAQINQLPPEQRQSIIALREQIMKSQQKR